jgi:AAA ATPase domain
MQIGRSVRSASFIGARWCGTKAARRELTRAAVGWWAGSVAGVAGFVGREREPARLRAALGGNTRTVLVVGDAGVGKARLAGEGMRRAVAHGLVSVWGRCLPLAEKFPLLRVAVSVALGSLAVCLEWSTGRALAAGASEDKITDVLLAIARWPGPAGSSPPLQGGDRARLLHRRRAGGTGRILTIPQLAACAGQLHGHWTEASMVSRDQPRDDGWTVVLRRQPSRIMNGRPQGPAARRSGGRTGSVSSPPGG